MKDKTLQEKMNYCIRHGIKIFPVVQKNGNYKLTIAKYDPSRQRWTETIGVQEYDKNPKGRQVKWVEKIYELYEFYFNKIYKPDI